MQLIVKIVAAIVPYLLRFLDRHSDEYLEALSKRIIKFLGGDNSATIKFVIIDESGKQVKDTMLMFNTDEYGEIYKKSERNIITITGLKEGKHEFILFIDDKEELISLDIEDNNSFIEKILVV